VQHPAKANTLLIQYLIEKFTEEGDTILDPMGGTGSTGVIAALNGRNAVLVDIEEKFVKWMIEAKRIVERAQTLAAKGEITILRGDARKLSKILNKVDSIVTSPPYEQSNCVREKSDKFWVKAKAMGKRWGSKPPSGTEENQYSDNNIGNLPHGSVDVVLTSPPYADAKKGEADEEKMAERWDKAAEDKDWNTWSKTWKTEGRMRGLKSLGSGYSKSDENIGNLPVGDIDAVITSPPYSESVNAPNDPERRAERMRKAGLDPKTIVGGRARCGQVDWKYGDGEDNIGNLSHGEISTIITSPPYLKSADSGAGVNKQRAGDVKIGCATKGREVSDPEAVDNAKEYGEIDAVITSPPYEESMSEKRHATPNTGRTEKLYKEKSLSSYPHSENQIGAMKKETYLEAMLKVYSEMFRVLKKSGRAIIIVKPFIRDKKVIDLPLHTWLLMQKAGFKLEKVLKLRLKQESFWRILYHRKFPEVPKIKHEYIIIARK